MAILKYYQSQHPELIEVLVEKVQGPSAARNTGMNAAKGEWLQFLDADDLITPNKIEHQIKLINSTSSKTMVIGAHTILRLSGKKRYCPPDEGDIYKALMKSDVGYTVCNLFKNKSGAKWDETFHGPEDMDFIFQYIKKFPRECVVYDVNPGTITRERIRGQITTSNPRQFNKHCLLFRKRVIDYLKKEKPDYYRFNAQFFNDILYYFIYRIGLFDIKLACQLLKLEMEHPYFPVSRPGNFTSKIHEIGYGIFGFKRYLVLRRILKDSLIPSLR